MGAGGLVERSKLHSLQAGRAVAALSVLAYHSTMAAQSFGAHAPRWAAFLEAGGSGVDVFFVLSGFIIYWTNKGEDTGRGFLPGYAARRGVRIYIPYLPIGIAVALGYVMLPQLAHAPREWSWWATITLLPVGQPALLPAWTLLHEVVFYSLMGLLLKTRRVGAGLTIWAALLLALWLPGGPDSNPFLAAMNLEFVFGVAAAWCVSRRIPGAVLTAGAVLCFVAVAVQGVHMGSPLLGLGVALALVPVVRLDLRHLWPRIPFTTAIGDASYSIYLVHLPLGALVARGVASLAPNSWMAGFSACLASGLLAGIVYHRAFETRALQAFRTLTVQSPAARSTAPPVPLWRRIFTVSAAET